MDGNFSMGCNPTSKIRERRISLPHSVPCSRPTDHSSAAKCGSANDANFQLRFIQKGVERRYKKQMPSSRGKPNSELLMKTKLELFAFILVALAVVALRVEAQAPPQFFTIHNFNGSDGDGALPVGNLVAGPDGIILGVTQNGGTSNANNGTFFALLPAGGNSYNFTNVYNFTGGSDGGHPVGDLTMQINGQVGNLATLPIKIKPQLLFDSGTVEGETRDSSGFMGLFFFYCAGVVIDGNDKFYIEPPPPTTNPPPPLVV